MLFGDSVSLRRLRGFVSKQDTTRTDILETKLDTSSAVKEASMLSTQKTDLRTEDFGAVMMRAFGSPSFAFP